MAKALTTTTYRWPDDSLIRRVDVREQSDGRAVAYLYADESDAAQPQRQALRTALRQKGWGTLSDYRDGAYALRISGLNNAQELLDLLQSSGAATAPMQQETRDDTPKATSLGQSIKDNSLRVSAMGYTLGNALYYASGIVAGNNERKRMATAFGVGDAALGIFGGRDDTLQYQSLLSKLHTHYRQQGIEVPKTASIHVETSTEGTSLTQRIYGFMHRYINPIKMGAEVLGGIFAFRSGLGNFRTQRTLANAAEMVGGAVVVAGWTGALLTPEKKRDPEALANAGSWERFTSYIQEKPTRLAGWAGYAFNAVGAYNFGSKWNSAEGKWGMAAVGSMVGSNTLYAMSHKAPGGDIKADAMVNDVYIVAAQILNKQPDGLRDAAIASTIEFLGARPEIKDTRSEIAIKLREQMQLQRQSPWFEKTPLPSYTPQPKKPKLAVRRDDALLQNPTTMVAAQGLQHGGTAIAPATAASIH